MKTKTIATILCISALFSTSAWSMMRQMPRIAKTILQVSKRTSPRSSIRGCKTKAENSLPKFNGTILQYQDYPTFNRRIYTIWDGRKREEIRKIDKAKTGMPFIVETDIYECMSLRPDPKPQPNCSDNIYDPLSILDITTDPSHRHLH